MLALSSAAWAGRFAFGRHVGGYSYSMLPVVDAVSGPMSGERCVRAGKVGFKVESVVTATTRVATSLLHA